MKKFLIVAAALLMLSCSCRNGMESKACTRLPRPAATPNPPAFSHPLKRGMMGTDDAQITLHVSRVIDGDTFEGRLDNGGNPGVNPWMVQLTKIVVRINGIDAPERGQWYGDVATAHLQWLISGKTLDLKLWQRDQYGRWIATAFLDGADIGAEMLKEGLAWHFEQYYYSAEYAKFQREAKQDGRGLWSDDRAVAPWEWRKMDKYERDAYR